MFNKVGFGCWINRGILRLAADSGRRHQSEVFIDARRRLLKARSLWCAIMLDLHRFMIAIAGVNVNHMMVRVVLFLIPLFGIMVVGQKLVSLLLGLMWILHLFLALLVSQVVLRFRFMVVTFLVLILLPGRTVLVFWLSLLLFLGTLHWPTGSDDLGHFGSRFLELLILF